MPAAPPSLSGSALPPRRWPLIDAIRGLILLQMVISHFGGPLRALSWQPLGFVSAAEGFFFLSDLATGVTYARRAPSSPTATRTWIIRHVGRIYRGHMASVLAAVGLMWGIGRFVPHAADTWRRAWPGLVDSPLLGVVGAGVFVHVPPPFDILPLYCLFIAVTPWIVGQCRAGRATRAVALSAVLWLASQATLGRMLHWAFRPLPGADLPDFDPLGWQIVFVAGVLAGWRASVPGNDGRPQPGRFALASLGIVALGLMVARHTLPDTMWLQLVTSRATPGPLRLVNFTVLALLVAATSGLLSRALPVRLLGLLGRHTLPVFCVHLVALVLITPWRQSVAALGPLAESAATVLFAASMYVPAMWLDYAARPAGPRLAPCGEVPGCRR
jgi:hypothetical protein